MCVHREKLSEGGEQFQSTDVIGDVTGTAASDVTGVYSSLTSRLYVKFIAAELARA